MIFNFDEYTEFSQIENICGKDAMKDIQNDVWDIFTLSYAKIGGYKSHSDKKSMIKSASQFSIVRNNEEKIIACSEYQTRATGLKGVGYGCDGTDDGKNALQLITRRDIVETGAHYWAEVSGAMEHYFKKLKGFPIPNALAIAYLEMYDKRYEGCYSLTDDDYHYIRPITIMENGCAKKDFIKKCMFGFPDENLFIKATEDYEQYELFRQKVLNDNAEQKINEIYKKVSFGKDIDHALDVISC